jgi:hypothetical protein
MRGCPRVTRVSSRLSLRRATTTTSHRRNDRARAALLEHLANASAARLSATRAADGYDLSLDDDGGADGEALARRAAKLVATGQTLECVCASSVTHVYV